MISSVRRGSLLLCAAAIFLQCAVLHSQDTHLTLSQAGSTIVLEPYAPNILRVTLSLKRESALDGPGYGFVAKPQESGWAKIETDQTDVYKSSRIVATVEREHDYSE